MSHIEYDGPGLGVGGNANETSKSAGRRIKGTAPHEMGQHTEVESTDVEGRDRSSADEITKTPGRKKFVESPHQFATIERADQGGSGLVGADKKTDEITKTPGRKRFTQAPHKFAMGDEHAQASVLQAQADELLEADEAKGEEKDEESNPERAARELQKAVAKALKELFEKIKIKIEEAKKVDAEQAAGKLYRDESLLASVSVLEKYLIKSEVKGIIKTAVEQRTGDLHMFRQSLKKDHIGQLIKINQMIEVESKE